MPDTNYTIDMRDIYFTLFEYLPFDKLVALSRYSGVDREQIEMILSECYKFHREVIAPLNRPGDEIGCAFEDGKVSVPEGFTAAYKQYVENGWLQITSPEERGGMGLPKVVAIATVEMGIGANCSLALLSGLSHAAAELLEVCGDDWMKTVIVPKLLSGQWQGTMCLTEASAGTAVGDITTKAKKTGDDWYLEGGKVFITAGEHDMCENHVHLVLARTEGAPKGFKGISLFLVPKYRIDQAGALGEFNDVICVGIEHKMGINASPTCQLQFGEEGQCRAWLIGEEGQGLPQMFHMMNEARIGVGAQGLALAAQATSYAAAYARERIQGVDIEKMRDVDAERIAICEHPDVRRMLLFCKSVVEGSRALLYKVALLADLAEGEDEEAKAADDLLELLTPICKAYVSDMAFDVTRQAMQIMGGYGYLKDYPVEQHLRDVKIASIYEGTNGVQALDLLGRKLPAKGGRLVRALMGKILDFVRAQKEHDTLAKDVQHFAKEFERWQGVTMKLGAMGMSGEQRYPVLCATPYLELAGNVVVAWAMLEQAVIAQDRLLSLYAARSAQDDSAKAELHRDDNEARFYFNKLEATRFFLYNVLTKNAGIAAQIESLDRSALSYLP